MKKYRYQKYNQKQYRINKKKKSIIKSRFFLPIIFCLVVLGIAVYFFVFSSFFQIKEIKITGNNKIPTEKILSFIKETTGDKMLFFIPKNIFSADIKKANEIILEKFVQAEKAEIKRKFPSSLIVKIEERGPVGLWCRPLEELKTNEQELEEIIIQEDICFNLDKEGIIFEIYQFEDAEKENGLVIKSEKEIAIGEKAIEKQELNNILEIYKGLKEDIKIEIKEFFVAEQKDKLTAETFENWEIYFNSQENILSQLFNLKLVLNEKIPSERRKDLKYIDLRFGNRIFYK